MKIFFITAYLGQPHGTAMSARDFARALLAVHDDVCIVSPRQENFGQSAADYSLSTPHWFKYVSKKPFSFAHPLSILTNIINQIRRWHIHRAVKGQHIIVNGWASYAYWKELAVSGYKKKSLIVRESPRHFEFQDRYEDFNVMLAELSQFDNLIFVSDRLRQEWMKNIQLASIPSFYVPNCCEEEEIAIIKTSDRQKTRERLGFAQDDFVLICPGMIEKRKGQDIILDTWPEVLDAIPHARLLVLGDGCTSWGKALATDVDGGKYGDCVSHISAQPSALEYLYASDVLLFPSRAEAMPRIILEGMALGMPIIATNIDGIPELIEDEKSGWLFTPSDTARMVNGIKFIAKYPTQTRQMAKTAEQRYRQIFSRQQQIKRVSSLLNWFKYDQKIQIY